MNINKFFTLAKNASTFSDLDRVKIGSVLVYKNKVISVGWNCRKSHPYQKILNKHRPNFNVDKYNNFLHSELNCLLKVKDLDINWSKAYMFVYREDKYGNFANCKPCKSCELALINQGIRKVFYTNKNGYNYIKI